MTRNKLKLMWVTPDFKKFAYEEKAENPELPLHKVLDKLAMDCRRRKGRGYF